MDDASGREAAGQIARRRSIAEKSRRAAGVTEAHASRERGEELSRDCF